MTSGIHVTLIALTLFYETLYPTSIKIDEVAGTTAHIGKVLDSEAQTTRARGADHNPVMIPRKVIVLKPPCAALI